MIPLAWKRRIGLAWHVLTSRPADVPSADADTPAPSGCPAEAIAAVAACPLCGQAARTQVCEFNKFVLSEAPPDEAASRYDYALCHGCGVVYASRRPVGARYQWLLHHFEETIGRADTGLRSVRKLTLSAFHLSDEDRADLRRALQQGVFVSEHLGLSRKTYVPGLLSDRLAVAPHVELLGSLLDLQGAPVLEVRPRTGAISAALARLYGTRPTAATLFEHQKLVVEELYGIPAFPLDFETFVPPDRGPYRLAIANHFLTHAVRPRQFLEAVRAALEPEGYLYLYNEPDDVQFLANGRSMINTLNPFHLQVFDPPALGRALAANGFRTVFQTHVDGNLAVLAQAGGDAGDARMAPEELEARRDRYARARDLALMSAPASVRGRFGPLWQEAADRCLARGDAEVDHTGAVRLRKTRRSR